KLAFGAQCPRRELNFLPAQRKGGVAHIIQGRNPDEARHHLLEQLEPFRLGVRVDRRQPGDVPAWTGEADRKPGADYIADRCHHDGNCSGRISRSERGGCASGHDDIDIETHQLRRQCREAFGAAIGRSILNDKASTLVRSETRTYLCNWSNGAGSGCGAGGVASSITLNTNSSSAAGSLARSLAACSAIIRSCSRQSSARY